MASHIYGGTNVKHCGAPSWSTKLILTLARGVELEVKVVDLPGHGAAVLAHLEAKEVAGCHLHSIKGEADIASQVAPLAALM